MATITCTRRFDLQPRAGRSRIVRQPTHHRIKLAKLALNMAQDIRSVFVKKKLLTTCAGTALSLFGCASEHSSSTQRLLSYDSSDAVRQAQLLIGFDYSRHLQSAARKESAGLHALFRFTDSDAFVGAGAEDHCTVLMELLRVWGDRRFASELARETRKIREAVIHALDYRARDWHASRFPATYALAYHIQIPYEPYSPRGVTE